MPPFNLELAVADRLHQAFLGRTRTLLADEIAEEGLPADLIDVDQAELVAAAAFAALIGLLQENDVDGAALRTLAGG